MRRRHPTLQTKLKISQKLKGRKKGKMKESTKKKISEAMKKHWATVPIE